MKTGFTLQPPQPEQIATFNIVCLELETTIYNVKSFASARALILWYLPPGHYFIQNHTTQKLWHCNTVAGPFVPVKSKEKKS